MPIRVTALARLATALILLLIWLAPSPAYGDVGVLLNESLDTSFRQNLGLRPYRRLFLPHLRGFAHKTASLPTWRARRGHEQLHHSW